MCHLCDDKFTGLGILEFVNRNRSLAESYGDQTLQAIRSGDSRMAEMASRQSARHAVAATHLDEEYRRRYKEQFGHEPE